SPKEAAQRTLDALNELCLPLRERWSCYEQTHGKPLDEAKYPEVARVRSALQLSEQQLETQDEKLLSNVVGAQQLIERISTLVQGALPSRSVRVRIARKLNQCIERFNRIDSAEI